MLRVTGGIYKGRKLEQTPDNVMSKNQMIRPTSARTREAVFDIIKHSSFAPVPLEAATFLDIYAGTAAVGIEAISRRAAKLILIDQDLRLAQHNIKALGVENRVDFIIADAKMMGQNSSEKPDFVYLDPPYDSDFALPTLLSLRNGEWLKQDVLIILELSAKTRWIAPPDFIEHDRRIYGAAQISFMKPAQ